MTDDDDDYQGPPRWLPGLLIAGVLIWVAVGFWVVWGLRGSLSDVQPDTRPCVLYTGPG